MVIRDLNLDDLSEITLLATEDKLEWKNSGTDLIVAMPEFDPGKFSEEDRYAFVFKISGIE
jgi:hypothetical protein